MRYNLDAMRSSAAALEELILEWKSQSDKLFEIHEEIDGFTVIPAIVFQTQLQWGFIVRNRYKRFNMVFFQFSEDSIIKLKSLFIWSFLISVRVDA